MQLLLFSSFTLMAQSSPFESESFTSSQGDQLSYRLLTPQSLEQGQEYPLVIFLHGAGERGSDNEKQLAHGSGIFQNPLNRDNFPCYAIFPQCPEDSFWIQRHRPRKPGAEEEITPPKQADHMQTIAELIAQYTAMQSIDSKRVYIIGLSMGAMAIYEITARFPELFAAAVPICGRTDAQRMVAAKDISFWIFHGDNDDVVPVEGSRDVYRVLRDAGTQELRYTEFAGCNHGSWNMAFNYPGLFEWLFAQSH